MSTPPTVSVIIPTYNRKDLLRETLTSLARQIYPRDRFEVIIVDDGSTDGTEKIAREAFPFRVRYFWQRNQGDAAARNLGAQQSQADILVFLDDDIVVEPEYLSHLLQAHEGCPNRFVVGTWNLSLAEATPFAKTFHTPVPSDQPSPTVELPFRDVFSNNLSLRREAYLKVGMMQGLGFSGSSMWCDLDFTYRAYRLGFEFHRSTQAICWHRDHAARNLSDHKKRMRTAAFRAVKLFRKYPELVAVLPMFEDKTPIMWGQDPPRLIARKLARSIASTRPALWSMEQIVDALEKRSPASPLLSSLYRYIIGGYIFQGYREGLREFKLAGAQA